jgi:molybdenum cofactor cytidylyltransferase
VSVVALVLAAGAGTRMGRPKQLLPVGGRPMLQHAVDAAAAGGLGELVLVLGHAADEVTAALALPPGARTVVNDRHAEGQATSLAAGLAAMHADAAAALVLLGDQPEVRPDAIRALVAARRPGGPPMLRAAYRGRPGHPVLLERALWPSAAALRGEGGGRVLAARDPEALGLVEVGGEPPEDIDTPEDHLRLLYRRGEAAD